MIYIHFIWGTIPPTRISLNVAVGRPKLLQMTIPGKCGEMAEKTLEIPSMCRVGAETISSVVEINHVLIPVIEIYRVVKS